MVFKNSDVFSDLGAGLSRRIAGSGGGMMAVEVHFKKNAVGAIHSHPHEQTSYVIQGSFELTLDGEKYQIDKGDCFYVPPNLPHGVLAKEEGVLLDVFTPQREDFYK